MKPRFSKQTISIDISNRMKSAMYQFREVTGKAYDPSNGYAQVPIGNSMAFLYYGQIDALESLLDDI